MNSTANSTAAPVRVTDMASDTDQHTTNTELPLGMHLQMAGVELRKGTKLRKGQVALIDGKATTDLSTPVKPGSVILIAPRPANG